MPLFSEGWCLSTRSTAPCSVHEEDEIEDDNIKDCYTFGKILSLNDYCIVREGFDKTDPTQKVIISAIEWQKIRNYHQSVLDHIRVLKEAEHENIANLVKVFVEYDSLMLSAYPERLKKELKVFDTNVPIEYMYIVTEFPEGIELTEYIQNNGPISEE